MKRTFDPKRPHGFCPVCDQERNSLPKPAEGNCCVCCNHLEVSKEDVATPDDVAAYRAARGRS